MKIFLGIVLMTLLLGCKPTDKTAEANGEPKPVACRMEEVEIDPITETTQVLNCTLQDYANFCNLLVTKLDTTCNEQCAVYKKRSSAGPKNPNLSAGDCESFPVKAKSAKFNPDKHCKKTKDDKIEMTCTVSSSCICDP